MSPLVLEMLVLRFARMLAILGCRPFSGSVPLQTLLPGQAPATACPPGKFWCGPTQAPNQAPTSGAITAVPGNAQNYPPNYPQPYPPAVLVVRLVSTYAARQPGYTTSMPASCPPQYPNVPGNSPNYPSQLSSDHPYAWLSCQLSAWLHYPGRCASTGPANYPANYQYPPAGQNYPPGYPPNYAVPPQPVPGDGLSTASTVPVSYGPGGASVAGDPYGNLAMFCRIPT